MHVYTSKFQGEQAERNGLMLRSSSNTFLFHEPRSLVSLGSGHPLADSLISPRVWESKTECPRVEPLSYLFWGRGQRCLGWEAEVRATPGPISTDSFQPPPTLLSVHSASIITG